MRFIRNALIFATAAYTLSGCGGGKKDIDEDARDENEDDESNEEKEVPRGEADDAEECDANTLELEDRIKANAAKLEEQSEALKQLREQHTECGVKRLTLSEKEIRQAELEKIKKPDVDKVRLERVRYKSLEKRMNKLKKEIDDMEESDSSRMAKEEELAGLQKTVDGMSENEKAQASWNERDSLNKKKQRNYFIKKQIIQEMIDSAEQEIVRLKRLLKAKLGDAQTKSREAQLAMKKSEVARLRSLQKEFESKEDTLKQLDSLLATDYDVKNDVERLQGLIQKVDRKIDWMSKDETRKEHVATLEKERDELMDKLTLAQVALKFNEYNQTIEQYHDYRTQLMERPMTEVENEIEELEQEIKDALADDTTAQLKHELKIAKSVWDAKRSAMRKFKPSLTKLANQILALDDMMKDVEGVSVTREGSEEVETILVKELKKLKEIKEEIMNHFELVMKLKEKGFTHEYHATYDQLLPTFQKAKSPRLNQYLEYQDPLLARDIPWLDVEELINDKLKANRSRITISKIIEEIPTLAEADVLRFIRQMRYDDLVGERGLLSQAEELSLTPTGKTQSRDRKQGLEKLREIVSKEAQRQNQRVERMERLMASVKEQVADKKTMRGFRGSIASLDPRNDIDQALTDIEAEVNRHIAATKKARK